MKKIFGAILFLALVLFLQGPGASYGQEVIKLKMADPFPIGHLQHELGLKLIEAIHKFTNQRVKIEYYPSEQLGKAKDLLILCSQGLSDISYVHVPYFAGQLPLNVVGILPFFTTAVEGGEIYTRLVNTSPEVAQEFQKYGTRVFSVCMTPQYDIGTVKKQVIGPADVKGLKLKTAGGVYDKIAQRYGIVPVNVAGAETYEAVQRGIVEGVVFSYPSIKGYRLNEILKYYTFGLRMGGFPQAYVINEKTWQKLPGDIQKALLKAGQTNEIYSPGEAWDREQRRLAKMFEKEGMVIYEIKPEDKEKWFPFLKGVEDAWIGDLEKKGLPGKKVFDDFKKICQEVVK